MNFAINFDNNNNYYSKTFSMYISYRKKLRYIDLCEICLESQGCNQFFRYRLIESHFIYGTIWERVAVDKSYERTNDLEKKEKEKKEKTNKLKISKTLIFVARTIFYDVVSSLRFSFSFLFLFFLLFSMVSFVYNYGINLIKRRIMRARYP